MLPDLFKRQMFLVVSQSSGYYDKQTYNSLTPELSALDRHSIALTQKTFSINFLHQLTNQSCKCALYSTVSIFIL